MDPLVSFLKEGLLPKDKGEAKKMRRKALQYWLFAKQKLYKRSHLGLYLLCMHPEAVCWRSCMREFVEATLGEGLCHIKA